jgi:alpha-glucosidase (family GH31 glycosyl hydrolase)
MLNFLVACAVTSDSGRTIYGNVRVEFLSKSLVRIEQRGPAGFEDRKTFTVVGRERPLRNVARAIEGNSATFRWGDVSVRVPNGGARIDGATVAVAGRTVFTVSGSPAPMYFPGPGSRERVYVLEDSPRVVAPAWGATPPPSNYQGPDSGWDLGNNAPDVYVFLNRPGGYQNMRREFLRLTGPVPLPPLFIFGFTDSRYHPYTEQEALDSIDTYRRKGIPLDMFVVDTDWRVNGSHGYTPEPKYFPDMPRFLQEAHKRQVRIMFNDHPEPQAKNALDPRELAYRWNGLTTLMKEGVDVWWYDRNWGVSLASPVDGLRHEVWGQREYHDITQAFRPDQRPLIMTNVDGIDGGVLDYPAQAATHRFPIWWTGDTPAEWRSLQHAVANGIDEGIIGFLPYVNDDLGGHYETPTTELYTRYLEYGCLCPITRVHCTRGEDRHPWAFGPQTEKTVSDYIKLRYRLLPTIYSAAYRAYVDGTPLLRRLDLTWPEFKDASRDDEYLLGDDLLVAPVTRSVEPPDVPIAPALFHTQDRAPGLKAEYFDNMNLQGSPKVVETDPAVNFDWADKAPLKDFPQEHFSVRWTGNVGPMPVTGDYRFVSVSDDGIRLFIDEKPVIDEWHDSNSERHTATVHLERGSQHTFRVEFFQNGGQSRCIVSMHRPDERNRPIVERSVWLPPGEWQDAWTGRRLTGNRTLTVASPLWHTPLWIREGGVVAQTSLVQHTTDAWWRDLTLDAYVPRASGTTVRTVYEDDGISNDYLRGVGRETRVRLSRKGRLITLTVGTCQGKGPSTTRKLCVRLHLDRKVGSRSVVVSGIPAPKIHVFGKDATRRMPLLGKGDHARTGEGCILEVSGTTEPGKSVTLRLRA